MNSDYYHNIYKGESNRTPLVQKQSKVSPKRLRGEAETAPNKNPYENKNHEEDGNASKEAYEKIRGEINSIVRGKSIPK